MSVRKQLNNSIRYPTSIIVKGANQLGVEIAKSLLEQGGYVIIIDSESEKARKSLKPIADYKLLTVLDFDALATLEDDLRRLDYVFYFEHKSTELNNRISTQKFLQFSNYLDAVLDLTAKFDAKFLLTTSITAHQKILATRQLDYHFSGNASLHTTYTELEIQKYAESLVKEYEDKVGINSRIVRLGEVLGYGIEIDRNSILIKLIIDGLRGKDLEVPGDGLEASYYVHYLDAAYGILKAQFSTNTKARLFTLANEEEISVLSVAYKLLELIPEAQEIKFLEKDDALPPLLIYRPADNLTNIGWKPKVTFERALAQTVEYIQRLLSRREKKIEEKKSALDEAGAVNVGDKLKDFFSLAGSKADEEPIETIEGALARLLAERREQEHARDGNIVMANSRLREREKNRDQGNFVERVDNGVHDFLFRMGQRVNFLKNITLTDFIFSSILLVAFVILYFLLISPLFSLSKNIFYIRSNIDKTTIAVRDFNFNDAYDSTVELENHILQAQQRVQELQFVFNVTNNQSLYFDVLQLLDAASSYSSGYKDVFKAYKPLEGYVESFNPQVTYRFSNSKLLSVGSEEEYSDYLAQMQNNASLVETGINKITSSSAEIENLIDRLPQEFSNIFDQRFDSIDKEYEQYSFWADYYSFLPAILGNQKQLEYLVVVQDNSRYTAGGGELTGVMSMTVSNGAIKNIDIMSHSALAKEIGKLEVSEELVDELNLLSNKDIRRDNVQLSDLALLTDEELYLQTIQDLYAASQNKNIDMAFSVNLTTIERMLQFGGSLEYQQIEFTKDNLLGNLTLLSTVDDFADKRDTIMLNVFAKSLEQSLNSLPTSVAGLTQVLSDAKDAKELRYQSANSELDRFLKSVTVKDPEVADKIVFGANYDSVDAKKIDKYQVSTVVIKVRVNADLSTDKSIELTLASGGDELQNSYICLPSGSRDFEYVDVDTDLITTTFANDSVCNIFLEDPNLKYGIDFNTIPLVSTDDTTTRYVLELVKNPGIDSNYDIEFTFADNFQVVPSDEDYLAGENSFTYLGFLSGNKVFTFELNN